MLIARAPAMHFGSAMDSVVNGEAAWETESARSGGGSLSGAGGVTADVLLVEEEAGEVFVALPERYKSGKSTLAWVLRHVAAKAPAAAAVVVVVAHVHVPVQMIPVMGSKFHASKLTPEQVSAYRQYERRQLDKHLDEYIRQCSKLKVKGKKLVIENEDVAKGIAELVLLHNVTKLVMGAAADKHYSRRMEAPKSKTALAVMRSADPSCKIWFVCKEHLIYTREIGAIISPLPTLSVRNGQPNRFVRNAVYGCILRSMSEKFSPLRLPSRSTTRRTLSRLSMEDISVGSWDSVPRESFPSSYRDETLSNSSSSEVPIDDVFVILPSTLASCDFPKTAQRHDQDDMYSNVGLFDKLEEAYADAEKYQKEAFDESLGRQKTEEGLISYHKKAKEYEDMSSNEAKQKKEVEEALAKANEDIQLLKEEMGKIKHNRDDILSKFSEVTEQKTELEQRVTECGAIVNDLEDTVAASRSLIDSHQEKLEQLKHERDNALVYAEEMRIEKENMASSLNVALNYTKFSLSELRKATRNFSDAKKVGEGGLGCIYRGFLRDTTVAIKVLHSQNLQGQSQFQQEVAVLSKVRHPNLVTLLGCCPEASSLVYEFLPNGSLEDRLARRSSNKPPLSWQDRTRIIGEVCSALVFLHSNKPRPIIHGGLNPGNILLDADLVSKLADFAVSSLLITDPDAGEVTPASDVYAFGVVVLRLVTGLPAVPGVARRVEEALEKGEMELLADRFAGEWPFAHAEKLMLLGLQCAEPRRRRRPGRMSSVWRVVEPLVKAASLSAAAESFGHGVFSENPTPFYFICPISQEVMRNPHIAADGFTYEAEAIRGWLNSGHGTSPMTQLALAHRHIAPNYALRSAIEEYMQQRKPKPPPPHSVRSTT